MIKNIEGLVEATVAELRKFADVAVVGMSGGADSTLVTVLCQKAFGKENVYGVHMPFNDHDLATFNSRSQKTATKLGVKQINAPIGDIANVLVSTVAEAISGEKDTLVPLSQVNAGNARSRARMCTLYTIAHHLGDKLQGQRVRVIGTGNLSEDFIGYDTKGGDALCDIFPIGQLFKSEVYQLLDYFRDKGVIDEDHIDRVPSAGLWHGQTDEAELGHTYNAMEPVVKRLLEVSRAKSLHSHEPVDALEAFVLKRHLTNKHKHEAPAVVELRAFCE